MIINKMNIKIKNFCPFNFGKIESKRGGKVLSVYWFAILVIVAVGIIAMVLVFYGKPYDIRKVEGEILINKIADCLSSEDGKLKQIISLDECHLDFGEKNEFYLEISEEISISKTSGTQEVSDVEVSDAKNLQANFGATKSGTQDFVGLNLNQGNYNLKDDCGKAVNIVCVEKNVYYLNEDGSEKIIKFLSVIGKNG